MKATKSILLLLLLTGLSFSVFAGDTPNTTPRNNVFTTYPISFLFNRIKVGYEFGIGPKKSLKLIPFYGAGENPGRFNVDKYTEYGGELQFRIYVFQKGVPLSGFYMAPYAMYSSITYTATEYPPYWNQTYEPYTYNGSASSLNFGYNIGWQHIYASTFTFDIYAGGGVSSPSGKYNAVDSDGTSDYHKGVVPHAGISVGFAF